MTIEATTSEGVHGQVVTSKPTGNAVRRQLAEKYCLTLKQVILCNALHERLQRNDVRGQMTAIFCTPAELVNVKSGIKLLEQTMNQKAYLTWAKEVADTCDRAAHTDDAPIVVVLDAEQLSLVRQDGLIRRVDKGEARIILLVHRDPGDLLQDNTWTKAFRDRVFTLKWEETPALKDEPIDERRLANSEARKHFLIGVAIAAKELGIEPLTTVRDTDRFVGTLSYHKDEALKVVDLGKRALCRAVANNQDRLATQITSGDVMGVMATPYSVAFKDAQERIKKLKEAGVLGNAEAQNAS